jgi:hypothetical protein
VPSGRSVEHWSDRDSLKARKNVKPGGSVVQGKRSRKFSPSSAAQGAQFDGRLRGTFLRVMENSSALALGRGFPVDTFRLIPRVAFAGMHT